MTPDDKRHGLVAGYRAGCRLSCCRRAIAIYNETLKLERLRGQRGRLVSSLGAKRRLEALACLGWSHAQVALRLGYSRVTLAALIRKHPTMHVNTHDRIAAVYEELCMTAPPESTPEERMGVQRTKARARRLGWSPPLAWDDIDNPKERPKLGRDRDRKSYVDHAAVERRLSGDKSVRVTPDEAAEICRRAYRSGRSTNWIEEHTGLKAERYFKVNEDAA